jgi:hypothetical protein
MDRRKNCDGLIRAFAALREPLRAAYQLVVACQITGEITARWQTLAEELGVGERVRLLGAVSDDVLRKGYQHCAAFAFASHCEGFGLPILEALACGAPVVAGANSSQPEVVGEAGLLADVSDPRDFADKLACLLTGPAAEFRRKSLEQAKQFSWARTAAGAQQALVKRAPEDRPKPLVALFAQFPPQIAPTANFAESLAESLADECTLHLYHEPGHTPALTMRRSEFAAFDQRLFARQRSVAGYDMLVAVDGALAAPAGGHAFTVCPGSVDVAAAGVRRELRRKDTAGLPC